MPLSLLRGSSRGSQKNFPPRAGMFALTDLAKSWQNIGKVLAKFSSLMGLVLMQGFCIRSKCVYPIPDTTRAKRYRNLVSMEAKTFYSSPGYLFFIRSPFEVYMIRVAQNNSDYSAYRLLCTYPLLSIIIHKLQHCTQFKQLILLRATTY